jgi:hypothetical protein
MLLAESNTNIERSHSFQETSFSIGDPILIMEYLRKNAYSNPKRAICQEIMSNARDAHREVGIDKSIEVTVPSRMSPTWSCRDFGPGIDPSRMSNVFTQFGKSTKRTDNTQTGGFGIGAKTPWAYTDTFTITTVCKIEGQLIKYTYAAVIGEGREPKLIQLSKPCSTKEHTGTTISFNVDAKDHYDFTRYTLDVTRFWSNRPVINGDINDYDRHWKLPLYEIRGDDWAISHCNESHLAVIDGIPYTLNFESIYEHLTGAEQNLVRNVSIHLFFGIGELSVSLNREALYYDDRTIKKVVDRIRAMISSVRTKYEQTISTSKTLWEAAISFKKALGFFHRCDGFLKGIKWNNFTIPTAPIHGNSTVVVVCYERDSHNKYAGRIRRFTADRHINFTENSMLIQGDSKTRIEYLFQQNPNLKYVYSFYKAYSSDKTDPIWDQWVSMNNILDLGAMDVNNLPSPPKTPREKREKKLIRYKTYEWKNGDWVDTEISDEELTNGKGIYVPCYRRQAMTDNTCTKTIGNSDGYGGWDGLRVSDFLSVLKTNVKVYGIQKDLLGELGSGWVTLYEYLRKQFIDTANMLTVPVGAVVDAACNNARNYGYDSKPKMGKFIDNNLDKMPKCILEWRLATQKVKNVKVSSPFKDAMHYKIIDFLKLNEFKDYKNLDQYQDEVINKCKLIDVAGFDRYNFDSSVESHLVLYLEAIKNKESNQVKSNT